MPIVAVTPDILYLLGQKMFRPTPTDRVLQMQIEEKRGNIIKPIITEQLAELSTSMVGMKDTDPAQKKSVTDDKEVHIEHLDH